MAEFLLYDAALPALNKALTALVDGGALQLYDRKGKGATLLGTLRFAAPSAGEATGDRIKFNALQAEVDAPNRGRVR